MSLRRIALLAVRYVDKFNEWTAAINDPSSSSNKSAARVANQAYKDLEAAVAHYRKRNAP